MPKEIVDLGDPHLNLVTGFWKNLRDDLSLHGVTTDSLPKRLRRRLTYTERVTIERRLLQDAALKFIMHDEDEDLSFRWWCKISDFDPEDLRERLLNDYRS